MDRDDMNRSDMDRSDMDRSDMNRSDIEHSDLDHTLMDYTDLDHTDIERDNWIERYVLGRLSVDEQIRFEEHFAECEQCVTELELAQDFDATLRTVVAEDTQRTVGLVAAIAHWLRRPPAGMMVAGLLLVALVPSLWLYSGQKQLRDQLERLGRPHGAIPGIELTLDRGVGTAQPMAVIPDPAEPWFALIVDVGDSEVATYSATLTDGAGEVRWRDEALIADPWGLLRILLPRDYLEAGDYQIDLEIREGSEPLEAFGRFPFRYAPSGDDGPANSAPAGAADTP